MARKPKSRSRRSTTDNSATRANSAKRRPTNRSPADGFLTLALLFDARGFSSEVAEVIELCAADPAMTFYLDTIDRRRIQREHALHADTARDLAHGEHLARATPLAGDHDALEDLDALFVAFLDLHMDLDRVARVEIRKVGPHFARLDQFHQISCHDQNLFVVLYSEPPRIA